ncbi:hypothetical protein CANARDRAFT_108078 [[Candida] arabinofermentans NRRL YB-2248]|uniref:Altered inheritance of mitochondria protein 41 n=1 Tax=[Candida] arabinofermentans NRRL YB-2248 TaxID=983967 RepID=A0A1E4STL1_9ASCO|nr:hypothetical protein CANARDRAFT_108078 [[Candida] arabinofermentans NRRL YB-2248]
MFLNRLSKLPIKQFYNVRFNSTAAYDEAIKLIRQDLKTNIRLKSDNLEKNVIRSILTEVKNLEISNKQNKESNEFQLYDLLNSMINQRLKTSEIYLKEGSPDRFKQVGLNELREIKYIEKYLNSLPCSTIKEIDLKVLEIANTLKKDGLLNDSKSLFSRIPWKTIQSDWKASKDMVSSSVNRIYNELK